MARPRTVSDDQILAATARVVAHLGPLRFTLADVARELNVTASAIVQRFGSKRRLLLALVEQGPASVRETFTRARDATSSPVAALLEATRAMASTMRSRREVSNSLAFLQIDLTDPEFHALTRAYFEAFDEEVRALLEDATRKREIVRADAAALTRLVKVAYNGAQITRAIEDDGQLDQGVMADVEAALKPYLHRRRARA